MSKRQSCSPAGAVVEAGDGVATAAAGTACAPALAEARSEEHTSELQSLMRSSYAVCCLKKELHTEDRHTNDRSTTAAILYYNNITHSNTLHLKSESVTHL